MIIVFFIVILVINCLYLQFWSLFLCFLAILVYVPNILSILPFIFIFLTNIFMCMIFIFLKLTLNKINKSQTGNIVNLLGTLTKMLQNSNKNQNFKKKTIFWDQNYKKERYSRTIECMIPKL